MTMPLPQDAYPEERRLATVLFADIQGFTALAEKLDFEFVSDLIKEVWLKLDQLIVDNGGYIDKHIGDEVMAVWGAPVAGEDDAKLAVATALELQEALAGLAHTSLLPGAKELRLKTGVHTGPVLATYVGLRNEYTVIGDTVNIAKRLAETAEPDTIVISENTFRMVRGAFRVSNLENLNLRGKTSPIIGFRVEAKLDQPTRVRYTDVGGLETRMVGRDAEMALLDAEFELLDTAITPGLALVVGETGMGKSRLLMEFATRKEPENTRAQFIAVRGLAEAEKAPFFLWKSLWKHRFGLSEGEDEDNAREIFLRGILQIWGNRLGPISAVEAAHLIGDLIGLNWPNSPYLKELILDPARRTLRAFELTREIFVRLTANGPVVLVVDDLQWVDKGSLDLLRYLFQPAPTPLPLFIVGGVRPDFLKQQLHWANLGKLIQLQPIGFTSAMVRSAYPVMQDYPEEFLARLAERTGGNPYFMEEIVKSLVQSEADDHLVPDSAPPALNRQLPENLHALLQARLDGISREARDVLLLASVVGRMFWVGAVKAAARQPVGTGLLNLPDEVLDRVVQNALRQIVRAELAFPRADSIFGGEQEYIFKHSMLQEVAYELLPIKYRKFYHYAVAKWLAQKAGPDFNVMIASHYEKAGNTSAAIRHFENAVRYAQSRGADTEVTWIANRLRQIRLGDAAQPQTLK